MKTFMDELFEEFLGDFGFDERVKSLLADTKGKSEEKNEDENDHSYFHSVFDKYEDGKHVCHKEKEVKDGKVLKDEEKQIEDKKEEAEKDDITFLVESDDDKENEEVAALKEEIGRLHGKLAEKQNRIEKLELENNDFKTKFNTLKELFN